MKTKPLQFKKFLFLCYFVGFIACENQNQSNDSAAPAPQTQDVYQDYIYQYSIIDALLAGVYDGAMTMAKLKTRGNFGLGGFNQLDGELYMNKGMVYKIRYDGSVHKVPDTGKTPVAFVKKFDADTAFTFTNDASYEQLKALLNKQLTENSIYAIRISGRFSEMKTRAPEPAEKPYPPLVEHLKEHQYEFDLGTTNGVGVGFYMPSYAKSVNVPGFHFHFLSTDKQAGGHVMHFVSDSLTIEIDKAAGFIVKAPSSKAFHQINLTKDRTEAVHRVESGEVNLNVK